MPSEESPRSRSRWPSPRPPAPPRLQGLETNAAATPLGIDDAKPKLSWRLDGSERGLAQTSYRVVVATTAARAAAGDGNVWDSGEVASSDPVRRVRRPRARFTHALPLGRPHWTATGVVRAELVRDRLPEPVRVEGQLDLRPGAHADAAHQRPGLRRRRLLHPGQRDPVHAPRARATGSCASRASPGSPQGQSVIARRRRRDRHARERRHGARATRRPCSPPRAGDTNLKVASVNGFAAGAPLTIGSADGDGHDRRHRRGRRHHALRARRGR